jgi:integrase/recombinase XerD
LFLSKHKNGYYYLHFTVNGKRKCITCKTKQKREAYQYLNKFQVEKKPIPTNQTLYIGNVKFEIMKYVSDNFTKSTYSIYKNSINHFERHFDKTPLKSITTKDIETYKAKRIESINKTTCNIELRTLKAVFSILVKWEYLSFNPFKDVKQFSITEKQRLCFGDSEIQLILGNTEGTRFNYLIKFALYTGCRVSEIINIQHKDIDFKNQVINIVNKENFKTKSGRIRQIPISNELGHLLNLVMGMEREGNISTFINPDTYLFTSKSNLKLTRTLVTMNFKHILRTLNINEKYSFHSLRHTFITKLIKNNININYVKEIAGHSDIKTTMNYIHIATNDLREAVNKIKIIN